LVEIQCQVQIPNFERKSELPAGLTVGDAFELQCQYQGVLKEPVELRLDQQDQYKLKLLSWQQNSDGLHLKVTSFTSGEHHLKAVQLVDAEQSIILSPLDFTVQTVIQQKADEKPEAFGPMGPFALSLPWWFFAMWGIVILFIGAAIFIQIKRRAERKRLVEEINKYGTSLIPYTQFTQTVRKLMREYSFLSEPKKILESEERKKFLEQLDLSYRIFIGRTFQVPSLHWADRVFLKEIKNKNKSLFENCGLEMNKVLRELKNAKTHQKEDMKAQDLIQLMDIARKNVDQIFLELRKEGRG